MIPSPGRHAVNNLLEILLLRTEFNFRLGYQPAYQTIKVTGLSPTIPTNSPYLTPPNLSVHLKSYPFFILFPYRHTHMLTVLWQ